MISNISIINFFCSYTRRGWKRGNQGQNASAYVAPLLLKTCVVECWAVETIIIVAYHRLKCLAFCWFYLINSYTSFRRKKISYISRALLRKHSGSHQGVIFVHCLSFLPTGMTQEGY